MRDIHSLAESLATQTMRLADFARDSQPVDQASASIIRQIVATAQEALRAGAECLKSGDLEPALFSIATADGAMRLIAGLISCPNDPLLRIMAEPFVPTEGRQQ